MTAATSTPAAWLTIAALLLFALCLVISLVGGLRALRHERITYHNRRFAAAMPQRRAWLAALLAVGTQGAFIIGGAGWAAGLLAGVLAWLGYVLLFWFEPARAKVGRMIEGKPEAEILTELQAAAISLDQLRAANAALPDAEITAQLDQIEEKTEAILSMILQQPEKFRLVRSFLSRHLKRCADAAQDYAKLPLDQREPLTPKLRAGLQAVTEALDLEQRSLTTGDALNLDVSLEVLEKTLRN